MRASSLGPTLGFWFRATGQGAVCLCIRFLVPFDSLRFGFRFVVCDSGRRGGAEIGLRRLFGFSSSGSPRARPPWSQMVS